MVVLMEYVAPGAGAGVGMATKRKGAEEPGLFACSAGDWDGDGGVPPSCRATKIRRLESADLEAPAAAAVSVGAGHGDDAMMGEELGTEPAAAPVAADADGEKRVVVYEPQAGAAPPSDGGSGIVGLWRRLRPWAAPDWVRDMLREADGRTVRALLSSGCAQEDDSAAAMAVVPWSAAPAPSASTDQAASSMAAAETEVEEEDAEGAAAMDIEQEEESPGLHRQTTQTFGASAGCREGSCGLYRWPPQQQHAMPLPAVGQASPGMWSW